MNSRPASPLSTTSSKLEPTDSRVVLDECGAERLLGNGDMLFLSPGTSLTQRGQGTFVSDDEIGRVMATVGTAEPQYAKELVNLQPAPSGDSATKGPVVKDRDELYAAAVEVVIREGRGSVSLLQRALGVGYGRGARPVHDKNTAKSNRAEHGERTQSRRLDKA